MFDLHPVPVPDLTGRTVLVTGANRGIGAATVAQLSRAGARVYAGMRHAPEEANARLPGNAIPLDLDVTDQVTVDAAIEKISRESGRLDALINNAGIISPIRPLASLAAEDLSPAFNVHVTGLFRMTMAALPLLRKARGVIVNAGTGAATMPLEGWTAYCASKAAARMLTQMMAKEFEPEGLRAFFLGIPPTDTDMQAEIRASGLNPVSRISRQDLVPPDVPASAMAWLCSADAQGLTTEMLDVRDDLFRELSTGVPSTAPASA